MLSRLAALVRLFGALLLGALKATLFLLRNRASVRDAAQAARAALEGYRPEACPTLRALGEGVYEVPTAASAGPHEPEPRTTVIYFTGTGETPTAPLAAYLRLIAHVPELATAEHLIVEAPWSRGAYYGASAFSARVWDRVAPFVDARPGPFVLVGLSRGALLALDAGERITEERGKVASVLALSPPLAVPEVLPRSVVAIAGFERVIEEIGAVIELVPAWAARFAERMVEQVHVALTAVIQHELSMLEPEAMLHAVHDVKRDGALASSGRAVREFRLLVEAHTRELELFARAVAATAKRTRRFFATLVWGALDPWAPALECKARMDAALARESTSEADVLTVLLPARGHGLFREHALPIGPLASLLERVASEAHTRQRGHHERAHRTLAFERKLRESTRPSESRDE